MEIRYVKKKELDGMSIQPKVGLTHEKPRKMGCVWIIGDEQFAKCDTYDVLCKELDFRLTLSHIDPWLRQEI